MGGKSTPDFGDIAASQGEENEKVIRDQTYANRPTQYTPWGYTSWTNESVNDPSTGKDVTKWSQTQGLTPELQDIYNKQVALQGGRTDVAGGLLGRMQNEFGQAQDWRGLSPMGTVPTSQFTIPEPDIGDPNAFRQQAQDAMYNQAKSRLDPMYDSKRQNLEIQMRNQGLDPRDEAWQSQMSGLGLQENDAYNQATWSSVGAGRDESDSMFGQMMDRNQNQYDQASGANAQNYNMALQGSQYANQIRQQQITEAMQKRGSSLNEINALLSGQQVQNPQMPQFASAGVAQPAPLYQGQVDAANIEAGQSQSLWGGLGDLAGAGLQTYGALNAPTS